MSVDLTKLSLSSLASSNKVFLQGSGSATLPAFGTAGEEHTVVTIPHNLGTDNLLFQVSTNSGYASGTIIPWQSNDGREFEYAYVDATNLYIVFNLNDSGGSGNGPATFTYYYRILVP